MKHVYIRYVILPFILLGGAALKAGNLSAGSDLAANLNAANAAMLSGNMHAALGYLAKAGDSPEALHARGVCALLQNDLEKAESLLREARSENIAEAAFNLQELQKKRENQFLIEQFHTESLIMQK